MTRLAFSLMTGCGCTEIACEDYLEIRVVSDAGRRVAEVEITSDGSAPVRCGTNTPTQCSFTRNADDSVTVIVPGKPSSMQLIRLLDADGALVAEHESMATISYETPNGEECPPKCKVGNVRF